MGTIQHHAIFVCGYEDHVQDAHNMARQVFAEHGEPTEPQRASLVTPIIPAQVNGYAAFFVAPDGSKEGWTGSDDCNDARAALVKWLRIDGRCRFVVVGFGEMAYRIEAADAYADSDGDVETWLPFRLPQRRAAEPPPPFKVGDFVRHKADGLIGVVSGCKLIHGHWWDVRVTHKGSVGFYDADNIEIDRDGGPRTVKVTPDVR